MLISQGRVFLLSVSLASLLALSGCNDSGTIGDTSTATTSTLDGTVVDDIIDNGLVDIYADSLGGELLKTTRTDENGSFKVDIDYEGVVVAKVTCDQDSKLVKDDGSEVACNLSEPLYSASAVSKNGENKLNVSPVSTAMVYLATKGDINQTISPEQLSKAKHDTEVIFAVDPIATNPVKDIIYKNVIKAIHDKSNGDVMSYTHILSSKLVEDLTDDKLDDSDIQNFITSLKTNYNVAVPIINYVQSDENISSVKISEIPINLLPQNGTQNYLFYGEVNPSGLGSLSNAMVFDSSDPKKIIVENNDTGEVSYPVSTTFMEYNATTKEYSDLYVDKLCYASNGKAYTVSLKKGDGEPKEIQNSSATNLSDFDYEDIFYLGMKQYLTAKDNDTNQTVLITPDMGPSDSPIVLGDRKFLSITYPKYGDPIDGFLVYNNETEKVQKCKLDMSECSDIDFGVDVGSRDFEGDIAGSTNALFMIDDTPYKLDKATLKVTSIDLGDKKIYSGHGTTSLHGDSFYFIGEDRNLYRVNFSEDKVIQITPNPDERIERIRDFTNDWVIYGSDTLLLAAKKDGTSKEPILLSETTTTKGYKYARFGVGDDFLFVTYSLDTQTGNTHYKACIFNNGDISCKDDSFWAGVSAKKSGILNLKSDYPYEPYAYIRVDNTDDFGGGTLKAVNPQTPFADGLNMGQISKYNFQTFLTNSRYINQTVDDEGGIVIFAKNDTNFHVDAFYMNLLKENSLVQLTDTDPFPDVISGRDHCHGRVCMICHNLAGGKIYQDLTGRKSAYGYRVKLVFENGKEFLADIAKGAGENFSLPVKNLANGKFQAEVLDKDGKVVNSSDGFYHDGVAASNCNYCHARYGAMREGAPGVIYIGEQSTEEGSTATGDTSLHALQPQTGTTNLLFYGEVNPEGLGTLRNVKVIDPEDPANVYVDNNDTSDVRSPVVVTTLDYNATTNSYSDFHDKTLCYVSNGVAYTVDLEKSDSNPTQLQNSSATNLDDPSYTKINYLGMLQYLIAEDKDTNQTILITPDMDANTAPIVFGDKKLLSVTYPKYGDPIDGYLVYNNETEKVQKCKLDMSECNDIDFGVDVGSRDFEDDLGGTTYSAFIIGDDIYRLNKADGNVTKTDFNATTIDRTYVQGKDVYIVGDDHNVYRVDMINNETIKLTPEPDDDIERIRAWTDNYVICGSDTLLMAFKKDGTSTDPIVLAKTGKTEGYKYVKEYGMGNVFLLEKYALNTDTGDTTYSACIFNDDNGSITCKEDSFWAGVAFKKEGTFDFDSSIKYTPYAYIRVDDTDNYGGGTLKAIDPAYPLDDGIAMGKVENYNFQTFITNSTYRYLNTIVDGNGGIVLYAKNDTTFHVDSFYMNLLKENSVVQLTNTDPFPGVISGRDHCHGRVCMLCHNLAGGKIYTDPEGSHSAYGYRVQLEFENGGTLLADIAKGAGENFSLHIPDLAGKVFKVKILDENQTVVNQSDDFDHYGVSYSNCNYCHGRDGDTRLGAPGAISVVPVE
ncbi:MAG: hypothetical protein GXO12_00755 [Epsilonproteobacteria bacterium]|nr:hypothetical protein [Campylobacterota bacterium]